MSDDDPRCYPCADPKCRAVYCLNPDHIGVKPKPANEPAKQSTGVRSSDGCS